MLETFVQRCLSAQEAGSIYISGIPGTGVVAGLAHDQLPVK